MLDFPDMEPGIDRNCAKTRSPASEQQFEKLGAVLHAQHDAVAGFEPACGETAGEARDAAGEFAIIPGVNAVADRRRLGLPASDIEQQRCEVHGDPAKPPFGIIGTEAIQLRVLAVRRLAEVIPLRPPPREGPTETTRGPRGSAAVRRSAPGEE